MKSKSQIIKAWKVFFDERLKRKKFKEPYKLFVEIFIKNDIPPIFETTHLSQILGLEKEELNRLINGTNSFYRSFKIPKRKGGYRTIASPYPSLLSIQRWIQKEILYRIILPNCAHGFIPKRSIVTNAKCHLNKPHLLQIDLKDFFPSINIRRVFSIFRNLGYPPNVCFALAKLCTLDEKLPQGAATSPYISNIIAKNMDLRIIKLCKSFELTYTRYADDMCVSGNYISLNFLSAIRSIIKSEGFRINEKKLRLIREHKKKIVTGISVSGDTIKLPRHTKRKLRQEVHFITSNGLIKHMQTCKIRDPIYIDRLIGKLNFWKQVEPENSYVKRSLEILIKENESITYKEEKTIKENNDPTIHKNKL